MTLYVATHNEHKLREIRQILPGFEVIADDPAGVEETAPDFIGNALIKVRAIATQHPGAWCLADDSGLEVKALGGAPGVRSARYAGEPSNTPNNNALLLKNLEGITDRTANFTCAVALVSPEGQELTVEGRCFGKIAEQPAGVEGFGYDPLFIPDGYAKSFAELTADEKNAISHRGRALEQVKKIVAPKKFNWLAWLSLFRIVNLPTVPGDVFVGAASAAVFLQQPISLRHVLLASVASCLIYLFGLLDNDLVGAKTDRDRPIPNGQIAIPVARSLRFVLCALAAAMGPLMGAPKPYLWVMVAFVMAAGAFFYNRTKSPLLMGLCRGLNVLCGVVVVGAGVSHPLLLGLPLLWTVLIAGLTFYSKGEDADPAKRARVGQLIGSWIYLQLTALLAFFLLLPTPATRLLLLLGAICLILLRLLKRAFPKVSAS